MNTQAIPLPRAAAHPAAADALAFAAEAPERSVLAVITGTEGPSYRPPGAMMAFRGGQQAGSLSSGCVEADLALHAERALRDGPLRIRYGRGSPFLDIQLPCGGGLEIALIPRPDPALLAAVQADRRARRPTALQIGADLSLRADDPGQADGFRVDLPPEPRFAIFGKGPEAAVFAGLVHGAGYPHILLSPEEDTLAEARAAGCTVRALPRPALPDDLKIDARTAVVLFFHDHDWEPPVLMGALASPAFYIGAQGSQRARDARLAALRAEGADPASLARLRGPIGLIPSTREPRVLAVSVLAEILAAAA
ncbi:XdhC family protein [Falsirhodobacter algicola]|uniref:XdhC family protein n=1 Tax=Falsirhodobacter algicola TaxID=2692330 RepID=A0A8J8MUR1_9RHOB|nr:XdhC family protein [Falsirhodobacter algicola]QUS37082.1 XdhC family protein [Falsirhodobacter algicola]